jgi:hypothetical protein
VLKREANAGLRRAQRAREWPLRGKRLRFLINLI